MKNSVPRTAARALGVRIRSWVPSPFPKTFENMAPRSNPTSRKPGFPLRRARTFWRVKEDLSFIFNVTPPFRERMANDFADVFTVSFRCRGIFTCASSVLRSLRTVTRPCR